MIRWTRQEALLPVPTRGEGFGRPVRFLSATGWCELGDSLAWDENLADALDALLPPEVDSAGELARWLDGLGGSFNAVAELCDAEGRVLLLFADRFGEYPLFHSAGVDGVRVSSEALEIATSTGARLDPGAALCIACFEFVPGARTAAQGILEVEPGGAVAYRAGHGDWSCSRFECWRPEVQPGKGLSEADLALELGQFLRGTASRMAGWIAGELEPGQLAAVPLSGGLDSRILLALLHEQLGDRLVAVCYGDGDAQEVEFSRAAAAAIGVQHRLAVFDPAVALSDGRRAELAAVIGLTTRLTLADGGLHLAEAFATGAPGGTRDVRFFLPGHSGDGISGSKMKAGLEVCADPGAMAAMLARGWRRTFPPGDLARLLRPEQAGLAEAPLRALRESCEAQGGRDGFERVQRWTLRELVRRRVLTELPFYRKRARALLPFFDRPLAEFFSTLPAPMLVGQRLYHRAAFGHVFTGRHAALGVVPFQGRTRAEMTGGAGGNLLKLRRRVANRILRELDVEALERRLTATPLVSFYRNDGGFRESILGELRRAEVLPSLFDREALLAFLEERLGRDDAMTTTGVWGLLTIERVGRLLGG